MYLFCFYFSIILSIIAFFILIATGMHIIHGDKHDAKMDDTPTTAYEPILSRTTHAAVNEPLITTTTTTLIDTSVAGNTLDEQDEATLLIARHPRAIDSGKCISCEIQMYSFDYY